MATDVEALVTTLKADVSNFESEMKKAGLIAAQEARNIDDSVNRAADGVRATFSRMAGMMVGTISATAIVNWATTAVSSLAELQRQAIATATSVEAMAGIQFAGKKSGVDENKAIKEQGDLARKVYKEIKDEEGEITKLFEANGMKLVERNGNMRELRDIYVDISKLVSNANNIFDAQEILKTVGLSNEWLAIMRKGPEAVRADVEEGQRLAAGLADAAAAAERFETRWRDAMASFSTGGKHAVLEVIEAVEKLIELIGKIPAPRWAPAIGMTSKQLQDYYGNSGLGPFDAIPPTGVLRNEPFADQDRALELALRARYGGTTSGPPPAVPPTRPAGILSGRGGTKMPEDDDSGKGGKSAKEKQNEFDREEKNMQRRIRSLGAEAEAVGKSAFEGAKAEAVFRLLEAAKQAGLPITDELRAKVEKLAEAYATAKVKLEEMQLAQRNSIAAWEFGGTQLVGILKSATGGMDGLAKAAERLVDTLFEASLQAMILGKGPLAGLFGMSTIGPNPGGLIGLLMGAFGGGSAPTMVTGGAGSMAVPTFSAGGMSGQSLHRMNVPASIFANAPHFATGGAMPAMLHPGEVILNMAQQRNLLGGMGRKGVTVNNYGGADLVDVRETMDGGTVVEIARKVAEGVVKGNNRALPAIMRERQMRGSK